METVAGVFQTRAQAEDAVRQILFTGDSQRSNCAADAGHEC